MSKELRIGDRTYTFGMLPAVEAVKVEIAIAKVIGEPLFQSLVAADKVDGVVNKEAIGAAAIGMLTSRMNADELLQTMETVFNHTSVNGERIEINSAFTGRNVELWKVFIGGLRYNFRDFFDAMGSILPSEIKQTLSSSNPPTSTGI
jgi:hypothetical protein